MELAKFEAFLKKEESLEISALVRGTQHLAYPIEGYAVMISVRKPVLCFQRTRTCHFMR